MKARLLLLVLLAAGCGRGRSPAPAGLQRLASGLAAEEPCARLIPSQWSASWPVPVVERGRLAYRVFFFGRDGDERNGFRFHQAEGDAEFDPTGRVLSCSRRPQPGAPLPASAGGAPEPFEATLAKERALYAMTEDVGALFAAGNPLTDEERKRVAEFASAFAERSESGHAAAYRALSPDFWKWIEENGGRSPSS